MKKIFTILFFVTLSLVTFKPVEIQAASMCSDNKVPPAYNQPVGTKYRGGDGVVYECKSDGTNASWQAITGVVFAIPNFSGFTNLGSLMSNIVQIVFFIAGLAFFISLVLGGIQWMSAGGDQKAMASARGRITSAVIGLIIVVAAYAITRIIGQVFGINIFGFKFK